LLFVDVSECSFACTRGCAYKANFKQFAILNNFACPDPRIPDDLLATIRAEDVNELTYSSYDAVWAMAAGFAHTMRAQPSPGDEISGRVSGASVYDHITSGAVSFVGAAGEIKFIKNGDMDLSTANMTLYNVRRRVVGGGDGVRTSSDLEQVAVGRISFDNPDAEPELLLGSYIEWANGRIYPSEVSSCFLTPIFKRPRR
jgi:hypothetical protein